MDVETNAPNNSVLSDNLSEEKYVMQINEVGDCLVLNDKDVEHRKETNNTEVTVFSSDVVTEVLPDTRGEEQVIFTEMDQTNIVGGNEEINDIHELVSICNPGPTENDETSLMLGNHVESIEEQLEIAHNHEETVIEKIGETEEPETDKSLEDEKVEVVAETEKIEEVVNNLDAEEVHFEYHTTTCYPIEEGLTIVETLDALHTEEVREKIVAEVPVEQEVEPEQDVEPEPGHQELKIIEETEKLENGKWPESDKLSETKNYQSVILEDWEVDVIPNTEVATENKEAEKVINVLEIYEIDQSKEVTSEKVLEIVDPPKMKEIVVENVQINEVQNGEKPTGDSLKPVLQSRKDPVRYSNLVVTKQDIVDYLDNKRERIDGPLLPKKDIFFSIELAKRLNQKLSPTVPAPKIANNIEKPSIAANNVSTVSNESLSESCRNTLLEEQRKIVEILESDEVTDWRPQPQPQAANVAKDDDGDDMKILHDLNAMEESNAVTDKKKSKKVEKEVEKVEKAPTPAAGRRGRKMDREMERTIALQQLRDQFPSTRKRSFTKKKVNKIPFLASTVLEKALTTPEEAETPVLKTERRRRPCYLPENVPYGKKGAGEGKGNAGKGNAATKEENATKTRKRKSKKKDEVPAAADEVSLNDGVVPDETKTNGNTAVSVLRTYPAKRKSTDSSGELKLNSEIFEEVAPKEDEAISEQVKPKKQKTVKKVKEATATVEKGNKGKIKMKKKMKTKAAVPGDKKRHSEVDKLLGDEGAIRMLYDTQHTEVQNNVTTKRKRVKTSSGLKKDLMLKTKLVKSAVMRLSGNTFEGVSLRGKRKLPSAATATAAVAASEPKPGETVDPLFATSTPNIKIFKPKHKSGAEASRILYRHSSSESFDSSEGFRRASFDVDEISTIDEKDKTVVAVQRQNSTEETPNPKRPAKGDRLVRKRMKRQDSNNSSTKGSEDKSSKQEEKVESSPTKTGYVPLRKSSRPRTISKKYSIWSSTSMDSLSVESLGLKKPKKSLDFGKKLNCREVIILQHGNLIQVVLAPVTTGLINSLNQEVLDELINVFEFLSEEESCKAVLLTSAGSTFCQGVDLCVLLSDPPTTEVDQLVQTIKKFATLLASFKKPVIAGVHAAALGLGVTLLPFCDVVISSDKASFYTPYTVLGQAPEGAATVTFSRINRVLVSELLYKCEKLSASEAHNLGLVTQILPEDNFEEEVMNLAKSIASQSSESMQSIKFLARRKEIVEVTETLQLEGEMLVQQWTSAECLNHVNKFFKSGELHIRQLENTNT